MRTLTPAASPTRLRCPERLNYDGSFSIVPGPEVGGRDPALASKPGDLPAKFPPGQAQLASVPAAARGLNGSICGMGNVVSDGK